MKLLVLLFAFFVTDYEADAFLNLHHASFTKYDQNIHHTSILMSPFGCISENPQVSKTTTALYASHRPRSGSFPLSNRPQPASRRAFIVSTYSFGLIAGGLVGAVMTANAKYGEGTSMELPSYIDYLIEKNAAADKTGALYQGVDSTTLLKRLSEAQKRLQEVPALASQQKWTQINGLVTGPLGTLSVTLNQIATAPKASSKSKDFVKQVKADVLAIGQGAARKNADACTKQAALAEKDLKSLLQEAFEG